MDNELFDLCKEVYKRTGWEGTKEYYFKDRDHGTRKVAREQDVYDFKVWNECPLYTSDYLLEKLPHTSYQMDVTSVGVKLTSFYTETKWETVHSNTPLKSLLKLTIALDDAKELPHESN